MSKQVIIVHARYVAAHLDPEGKTVPGRYEYPEETISYPDDCMLQFQSDQGALIIKRQSSGEPIAAFRGLHRFRTSDVTLGDVAD